MVVFANHSDIDIHRMLFETANLHLISLFPDISDCFFLQSVIFASCNKVCCMKKILLISIVLSLFPVSMKSQTAVIDSVLRQVHDCDLFFQIAATSNAITDVTDGVDNLDIEHVGIYAFLYGQHVVIEAVPRRGVCITPADLFMNRNLSPEGKPLVIIGRVAEDVDVKQSLENALGYVGCGYDSLYLPDNKEIYCSELVQKSFVNIDNKPVFTSIPMTFRDKDGNIPKHWTEFYERHGMTVPESAPGTNPGELSRRHNVDIILNLVQK